MGPAAFASLKDATREATRHANACNCFAEEDAEQRQLVSAWVEMVEIAMWLRGSLMEEKAMAEAGAALPAVICMLLHG
eukprot:5959058-Pyramimonas_sp.AAC.1